MSRSLLSAKQAGALTERLAELGEIPNSLTPAQIAHVMARGEIVGARQVGFRKVWHAPEAGIRAWLASKTWFRRRSFERVIAERGMGFGTTPLKTRFVDEIGSRDTITHLEAMRLLSE